VAVYYVLLAWWARAEQASPLDGLVLLEQRFPWHRLRHPGGKTVAALALVVAYLAGWLIRAGAVPFAGDASTRLITDLDRDGQACLLQSGDEILILDCGSGRIQEVADLVNRARTRYLAEPAFAYLCVPEQRYFNDLGVLAGEYPWLKVYAGTGVTPVSEHYQPLQTLLAADLLQPVNLVAAGTVLRTARFKVRTLYPTPGAARDLLEWGMAVPPERVRGRQILERYQDFSAVLDIRTAGCRVIYAPLLGNRVAESIARHYPDLRADWLVVGSPGPPPEEMASLARSLRVRGVVAIPAATGSSETGYGDVGRRLGVEVHVLEPGISVLPLPGAKD